MVRQIVRQIEREIGKIDRNFERQIHKQIENKQKLDNISFTLYEIRQIKGKKDYINKRDKERGTRERKIKKK